MNAEFFEAIEAIEKEKGIPRGYMYEAHVRTGAKTICGAGHCQGNRYPAGSAGALPAGLVAGETVDLFLPCAAVLPHSGNGLGQNVS